MMLAVDAGNSRVKWGWHDGRTWLKSGAAAHAEIPGLRKALQALPPPRTIAIVNVGGEKIRLLLEPLLSDYNAKTHWIESCAVQCGVRNGYEVPAQLGADRWAAAIAAWHLFRHACIIVNAGTAVTIDALSHDGVFLGGLILPGPSLMREALAQNTELKFPRGQFRRLPATTADAIESGILQALLGAVERMGAVLGGETMRLLSGGGAFELVPHLNPPPKVVDNLVLEGLILIAGELDKK